MPRKSSGAAIASRSPSWTGGAYGEVVRVLAAEQRVEEPAVQVAVHEARGLCVLGGRAGRLDVGEVERDPDIGAGGEAAQHRQRPAVREEEVVRGRDRVLVARPPGRVHAPAVAEPGGDPRLVVRHPARDAVAEPGCDGFGVADERLGGRALGPAARVLERLREIPVIQGDAGGDSVREQLVDQPVVEVEPRFVHAAGAVGQHPRPGDREPERVESRARASARCPPGSGGRSRRRPRRCRRFGPCRGSRRSGPRCCRCDRPPRSRLRSGTTPWRRPTRTQAETRAQTCSTSGAGAVT